MKRIVSLLVLAACGLPPEIQRPVEPVAPVEPAPAEPVKLEPVRRIEKPFVWPVTPVGISTFTRTVSDETTLIDLQLNEQTVFCTVLGYGGDFFLKVSIPQLDQLAHFDHRVEGTNLPCAAVGLCSEQMNADNILQGNPGIEPVWVRVVLVEHLERDGDLKTCRRQLVEDVSATIRGVPVKHHVEGEWESMPFAHCAQ
jgi:hypothetical protein